MSSNAQTDSAAQDMIQLLPNLYLESGRINGQSVRYYRKLHRLNQTQLADLLSISRRTLSSVERGGRYSRRTEEVLYQFVQATRRIVNEYGILPPGVRFDAYLELPETVRKETIQEFYVSVNERVVELRAEIRRLNLLVDEKDALIRDLMKHRVHDVTGMQRQVQDMAEQIEELKQQIERSVA